MAKVHDFIMSAMSYWWVVFPLGGVVGGWARHVAKYNEKRRSDKIELERIRANAKTEQLRITTATDDQIAKTIAQHDATDKRWFDYETNLATILDAPMMTDMREPATLAFHKAKIAAEDLRPVKREDLREISRFNEYRDAVRDYGLAFDAAEREAKRRRLSGFSPIEREKVERAQKLVKIALDQAATPAERQSAYRRARDELDGLIVVPDPAATALESAIAGELNPGPGA